MSQALSIHDKEVLIRIFDPEDLRDFENEQTKVNNTSDEIPNIEFVQQEKTAIYMTEIEDYDGALKILDSIIEKDPNYASVYNNRAQVYQLMKRNNDAIRDLDKALEINGGKGKVGIQALTQRGILRKVFGEDNLAQEDWKKASALGGQFANRLVIMNNPYAALCNQMLNKMFADLRCGQQL